MSYQNNHLNNSNHLICRTLSIIIIFSSLFSISILFINQIYYQYHYSLLDSYYGIALVAVISLLEVYLISILDKAIVFNKALLKNGKIRERFVHVLPNVIIICLFVLSSTVIFASVATTPFHPIDAILVNFDKNILEFNQNKFVHFFDTHALIYGLMLFMYFSLTFIQAVVSPLILIFVNTNISIKYYTQLLILTLLGSLIYFFFPTMSPASMLHQKYLSISQIELANQFHLIRIHSNHLILYDIGLISMPSFHVIYAVMLSCLTKGTKLFYFSIIWASLVIISTVALGWHYVLDVVASLLLVAMVKYLWNLKFVNRSNNQNNL